VSPIEPAVLATPRLRLRPFREEDAAEAARLAGDRAIWQTTIAIPHPYSAGQARQWIATLPAKLAQNTEVVFAIALREDDSLIGAVGLSSISTAHHRAELGYWVARHLWNRGYCTEAARAVLAYGFGRLGLERIHARHFAGNDASGRVMAKLGMRPEGVLRQHILKQGRPVDLVCHGILRDEFAASPGS